MNWGSKTYTGVIAQELEKIVPSMVGSVKEENGIQDFKTVDGNEFTYMLINAVKELKQENEALLKRLEALEAKVK